MGHETGDRARDYLMGEITSAAPAPDSGTPHRRNAVIRDSRKLEQPSASRRLQCQAAQLPAPSRVAETPSHQR